MNSLGMGAHEMPYIKAEKSLDFYNKEELYREMVKIAVDVLNDPDGGKPYTVIGYPDVCVIETNSKMDNALDEPCYLSERAESGTGSKLLDRIEIISKDHTVTDVRSVDPNKLPIVGFSGLVGGGPGFHDVGMGAHRGRKVGTSAVVDYNASKVDTPEVEEMLRIMEGLREKKWDWYKESINPSLWDRAVEEGIA